MKNMIDINNNKVDTVHMLTWQQIFPHNFMKDLGDCDKEGTLCMSREIRP